MPDFPNVLCVGMHFRGQAAVNAASLLTPESPVRLEREPDNAFDAYAIKVMLEDIHIGYLERGQAAWISPLLDDGAEATAELTGKVQRGNNLHPIFTIHVADT
jgi:hypothetical protein